MTITIPDNALAEANISPDMLLLDIAAYLYEKKTLSIGQARKIAGLDLISFQQVLHKRGIFIHYDISDLEKDLANLEIN